MEVNASMRLLLGHLEGQVAVHVRRQGQWKLKSYITVPTPAETSHLCIYTYLEKGPERWGQTQVQTLFTTLKMYPPCSHTPSFMEFCHWQSTFERKNPLTTSEPAGMGPQSHPLNWDVYPLSVGDPSVDQHLWHRDAKNTAPADHRPFQGSLHTHIQPVYAARLCLYLLLNFI